MSKPLVDMLLDAAVAHGHLSEAEAVSFHALRETPAIAALINNYEVAALAGDHGLPPYTLFKRMVIEQMASRLKQDVTERADRARYAEDAAARKAQLAADAAAEAAAAAADAAEARAKAPTAKRVHHTQGAVAAPKSVRQSVHGNVIERS